MPALRHDDGNARSGARRAVESGSVLGLSALRTTFLDDLPAGTPNALTPSQFLTSRKEPPTLAAFSSSACAPGAKNRVPRELTGQYGRPSALHVVIAGRVLRPPFPATRLVELAPGICPGVRSSEDVCQPGPSRACSSTRGSVSSGMKVESSTSSIEAQSAVRYSSCCGKVSGWSSRRTIRARDRAPAKCA